MYQSGEISHLPRMVAGSSWGQNPIIESFLKQHTECRDLPQNAIRESRTNEALVNWHSLDGDAALRAVQLSGGWGSYVKDRELIETSRLLEEREGLSVLPASCAGLAALISEHRVRPLAAGRYVVVLTSKKRS